MRLRVATYNIRKCVGLDWRRRPDRILSVLDEIGADVVALQEADRRFGTRAGTLPGGALAGAGWRAAPVAPHVDGLGWRGNAVLLGPRVEAEETEALALPGLEPRGAAVAELRADGRPLRVVAMHLALMPEPRLRQAQAILAALGARPRRPTILLGDMNEPRPAAGPLAAFARGWRFAPPALSFHAAMRVAALDRIGFDDAFALGASGAHDSPLARRASDHLPVWADLDLAEA